MNAKKHKILNVFEQSIYMYISGLYGAAPSGLVSPPPLILRAAGVPEPSAVQHLAGQQREPADAAERQNTAPQAHPPNSPQAPNPQSYKTFYINIFIL